MSLVSTAVAERDWALFVDWCHAADVDETTAGETEIGLFTREVSGSPAVNQRRLDHLRALRMTPEQRRQPGEESTAAQLLRAACGQVLALVAVAGWPGGVQGRRDAFVLVLRGHLGMTRRQVRALSVSCNSAEVQDAGCEVNTAKEGQGVFVIPSCDAPPLLEPGVPAFNGVAFFVRVGVERRRPATL